MRIHYLVIALFLAPYAYAGSNELAKERANAAARGMTLTTLEETQLMTRGWRDRREGEPWPFIRELSKPSDYEDEYKRGTVEWVPGHRNYSRHKVRVPNGTVFDGVGPHKACNFAQVVPNTEVFERTGGFGHNLVFKSCNLYNVRTYPDWTIEGGNTAQADLVPQYTETGGEYYDVHFVAGRSENIPANRSIPAEALR